MTDNRRTRTDRVTRAEEFAAELTSAAYPLVLRRGLEDSWLKVELGLWKALAKTVRRWARQGQPAAHAAEREAWREGFLRALIESVLSIALDHGSRGPRSEVESVLDQAFRQVIRTRVHVK